MFFSRFWFFFLEGNSILHILNLLCPSLSNSVLVSFYLISSFLLCVPVFSSLPIFSFCAPSHFILYLWWLYSLPLSWILTLHIYHFLLNHHLEFWYFCFWCALEKLLPNFCLFVLVLFLNSWWNVNPAFSSALWQYYSGECSLSIKLLNFVTLFTLVKIVSSYQCWPSFLSRLLQKVIFLILSELLTLSSPCSAPLVYVTDLSATSW